MAGCVPPVALTSLALSLSVRAHLFAWRFRGGAGPEGTWLVEIEELLSRGVLSIETIVFEASRVDPRTLQRLQVRHGYDFYRLDEHDYRRLITSEGWDACASYTPRASNSWMGTWVYDLRP